MLQDAPPVIVWLRRDLRLHDHAALAEAARLGGPLLPVFVLDRDILAQFPDLADRRLGFIAAALTQMDGALRAQGGGVLVLAGRACEAIPQLAQAMQARAVCAAEDYEPAMRARDAAVARALRPCPLHLVKDHVIHAPQDVTRDGAPYKVYTPYARAWRARLTPCDVMPCDDVTGPWQDCVAVTLVAQAAGLTVADASNPAALLAAVGYSYAPLPEWPVVDGPRRLAQFVAQDVASYAARRDRVDLDGTSRLSPYLRFGLVSVRACWRAVMEHPAAQAWCGELIWREFYAMILHHFPQSAREEWNPACRGLPWRDDGGLLARWKDGRTGFPIVDAAMRQLAATGWMHNRARMIVASFLTKDLLLDWRLGEAHFAQLLMDYDMASNVGGWQWSASTGTDAQPWFRVFNPVRQSRKCDPDGVYIRRYVPELRALAGAEIHDPPPLQRAAVGYPPPVVDHDLRRAQVLAMFRAHRAGQAES